MTEPEATSALRLTSLVSTSVLGFLRMRSSRRERLDRMPSVTAGLLVVGEDPSS